MKPIKIKMHHRSSKWDRATASLKSSLTISNLMGASVIVLTEVADGKRPKALEEWVITNNWSRLQEDTPWQSGEVAILVDQDWDIITWETVNIGPDLGPGLPVVAIIAALRHKIYDISAIVATSHLPSAVESGFLARTKRAVSYRKMVKNYRKAVADMRQVYQPDIECISADWNLDVLKKWVRIYLGSAWPAHFLIWDKTPVGQPEGTHGNRQIDAWLVKDLSGNSEVLEAHRSSDHRGLELTITGFRRG